MDKTEKIIFGGLGRALVVVLLLVGTTFGLNWAFDWMDQANSAHNIAGLVGFLLILTADVLILRRIFKTHK